MRLLIHDFAGHPFQVQLSRELASRGHTVIHAYPIGLEGPKGKLQISAADPSTFSIVGVQLSPAFRKYSPVRRLVAHRKYAKDLKALIRDLQVDLVLSGNTPIDIQAELLWHCRRNSIYFVHWVQDLYSHAVEFFLRKKVPPLARPLSYPFRKIDKLVARLSDHNIVISPAFSQILLNWGVNQSSVSLVENWAPLEELKVTPRINPWSTEHALTNDLVFLYSGTLGIKHRPDLLYRLAQNLESWQKVVVISEGPGREFLESQPKLKNLVLLDFQPYDRLSEVLGSADVLLATLETDAGVFAVPSKILTYLCAAKPLLFAGPLSNLSTAVVRKSGGGIAVDPDEPNDWIDAAKLLACQADQRATLGASARRYASETFDITCIASQFEAVFSKCGLSPASINSKARAANSSN